MRRLAALMAAAVLTMAPFPAGAADITWEHWQSVPGVFDAGGPRHGSLVVAGSAALYLVQPEGFVVRFARSPEGYRDDPGAEAYLAVSPGGHVAAAGCDFAPDETFVLRLHVPLGLTRVTAAGDKAGPFANLGGVASLTGIAFDATGSFDHRLLVSGPSGGKTVILAVDCTGASQVITSSAPVLEGGLAVAPSGFGSFGGELIAPDELSGKIYAIAPDGSVSVVARPPLPTGGDIGVEGLGFVPPGLLSRGGYVYYADRLTPNNPHPGTDHLLRLASADLLAAGVQEGDLLAATEGGAAVVAVRCAASCTVIPVVAVPTTAHGEGHLAFTVNAVPSPSPASVPQLNAPQPSAPNDSANNAVKIGVFLVLLLLLIAVVSWLILRRQRRTR